MLTGSLPVGLDRKLNYTGYPRFGNCCYPSLVEVVLINTKCGNGESRDDTHQICIVMCWPLTICKVPYPKSTFRHVLPLANFGPEPETANLQPTSWRSSRLGNLFTETGEAGSARCLPTWPFPIPPNEARSSSSWILVRNMGRESAKQAYGMVSTLFTGGRA